MVVVNAIVFKIQLKLDAMILEINNAGLHAFLFDLIIYFCCKCFVSLYLYPSEHSESL